MPSSIIYLLSLEGKKLRDWSLHLSSWSINSWPVLASCELGLIGLSLQSSLSHLLSVAHFCSESLQVGRLSHNIGLLVFWKGLVKLKFRSPDKKSPKLWKWTRHTVVSKHLGSGMKKWVEGSSVGIQSYLWGLQCLSSFPVVTNLKAKQKFIRLTSLQ